MQPDAEERALTLAKAQVRAQFGVDPETPTWHGLVMKLQRALMAANREGLTSQPAISPPSTESCGGASSSCRDAS